MPTQAELDQLDEEFDDLRVVLTAALVEQWAESVAPNPADAAGDLQAILLDLLEEFGPAAASIGVDFYSAVRPTASPSFTPVAVVADDLLREGTLRWSAEPLATEEWQAALDRSAAAIQKSVKQALVDTIGEATTEDPLDVRFARWPQNADPCAWCVLRASRGAVYWTEATAERGDHVKCGCRITPVFPDEPLPYQLKPYKAQYLAGAAEADGPGRKALLSGMRRANGIR